MGIKDQKEQDVSTSAHQLRAISETIQGLVPKFGAREQVPQGVSTA